MHLDHVNEEKTRGNVLGIPKNFLKFELQYIFDSGVLRPHQWLSDSELKAGRWELPGSIPGGVCQTSRSEFSKVFSETRVNTG